jgi:predicted transcriptional regulator
MKCCKCSCSFEKCIEEHKNNLNKEFNEMITNWMNNHPEVKMVWIGDRNCYLPNSMTIYPNEELSIKVRFE